MDNQHQQISGYRDLTQDEIDLINEIKEAEAKVLALHRKVERKLGEQATLTYERERQVKAQCFRWHAIARSDIEKGFMALVRAIAQPQPREEA